MADDVHEMLRDAAPRPGGEPDFERLWQRGRRQRHRARLAGAMGAVVALAVAGVGIAQLAVVGPTDVEVVDQPGPGTDGASPRIGVGETDAGVPYSADLRVAGDDLCVEMAVGVDGEGDSWREFCDDADERITNEEPVVALDYGADATNTPDTTAIAVWTPHEVDHVIWALEDEELRVDTSTVAELPGSAFVAVIDGQPTTDTTLTMYDASGDRVDEMTIHGIDFSDVPVEEMSIHDRSR